MHAGELFPGFRVLGCSAVPRHAQLRPRRSTRTRPTICSRRSRRSCAGASAAARSGSRSRTTRPPRCVAFLRQALRLETDDVYLFDGPLHLADLAPLGGARRAARAPRRAVLAADRARRCRSTTTSSASSPSATSCCTTRTSRSRTWSSSSPRRPTTPTCWRSSRRCTAPAPTRPIVRALIRAAENGKQVTAVVELKARFDEAPNIPWARTLEEAGVHVVYGLIGLKTHCKVALVVRREGNRIKRYVHLSTGNYNPSHRAHLHRPVVLHGARRLRRRRRRAVQPADRLLVAAVVEAVRGRAARACTTGSSRSSSARRRSGSRGRIIAKMNALVDPQVIKALYRASQAGVSIDLIVRGICCLRPGVPGDQRQHPRASASSTASSSTRASSTSATAASARSTCRRPTGCRATSSAGSRSCSRSRTRGCAIA